MLYYFANQFVDTLPILNVLKYITFRSALAVLVSLSICLAFGNRFIAFLKVWKNEGQPIREDGPASHFSKKGTPTMGGLLMLGSITFTVLLLCNLENIFVWCCLIVTLGFGFLGFMDDYLKIKYKNPKGISGKTKLFWQFIISLLASYIVLVNTNSHLATTLTFPFFKSLVLDLGIFYIIFAAIVITGASNAVNLTDGLDGLATIPIVIVAGCFAIIAYLVGHTVFADYLQIPSIPESGEIAVFCGAIIGAGLGFLWFNCAPAQVFMGDVGSLALGGALGIVSVISKHEIVLAIVGMVFVVEALSVMIQVSYFKYSKGKRIFLMAPIHHHFEKKGWPETKVVVRFWIISIVFALIGLATLKLR